MPKVSIIIPVYNTEKYLRKCLDSVCNQTLSDIEIICINDCSSDNSLEILREYSKKDERIKLIDFKENKGVSIARNTGIDEASGEYIGFVDSDDFVDLDFYEKLYNGAVTSNADVAKGTIKEIFQNGEEIKGTNYDINDEIEINKAFFYHSFTSAIYKRGFIFKHSIKFPENISHFEDPCFAIQVALYCNMIIIVKCVSYNYYRHYESETKKELNEFIIDSILKSIRKIVNLLNSSKISNKHYNIVYDFLQSYLLSLCHSLKTNANFDLYNKVLKGLAQFRSSRNQEVLKSKVKYANPKIILDCYKKYDALNDDRETFLKIIVSYIKPSFLFKSQILTPLHLGRAVENETSKDGKISEVNLKWLHQNCQGDDDFEGNISSLNRRVGFFTGTYWAWKNYEKLGNPEYFGSFGYRKLLAPVFLNNLSNYDLVLPEKTEMMTTLKKQMIDCHGTDMYEATINIMKQSHPDELQDFIKYLKNDKGYFYELYIMKKEMFFDFCPWIYKIINSFVDLYGNVKIDNHHKFSQYEAFVHLRDVVEIRDVAFMLERITGYYLYKKTQENDIKYLEVTVLSPEETTTRDNVLKRIRQKVKNK